MSPAILMLRGCGWAAAAGWAVLSAVALLALGGAAARPGGILVGLPSQGDLGLLATGLGLIALLAGARSAAVCVGLAPVPLLLLSGLPLPGIGALSGPPLLGLAFAGSVLALAQTRSRIPRRVFFPVVLALYLWGAARVQSQVGAEGDEPHYLMVADSILRDGDVSLANDYEEGRYRSFYRGSTLAPHYRVRGKGGQIYSLHALGLSLLVLPFYALGGYPAASFFMAFLAALVAREIRELVRGWSGSDGLAEGMGWTVALGPPLIHYAGLVFTEVPAALAVALALRRGRGVAALSVKGALGLGMALAFLPWLNVRYAPLAAILLLLLLSLGPNPRRTLALILPGLASAACLAAYHFVLYGFFDPRRVYGRRPELSLAQVPDGLQGLLLDQEFGLLVYAPVFSLAVPGLVALFGWGRRQGAVCLALVGVVVLTAASWPMWRGGFNPPARFLVPVLPVLAVAAAARLRRGLGAGAALLIGWTLFMGLAGWSEPRLVHRDRDGNAPLLRANAGAEEWTRLLPGYVLAESEPDRRRLALVWASALALATLRWRWPRQAAVGLAVGVAWLAVAAGIASTLSHAHSGGRDAVRLVGRPTVSIPGWVGFESAPARWGPDELEWGPIYEPHRHPDGAVMGSRLALPPGRYRFTLEGEEASPMAALPDLEVRPEGAGASPRRARLERVPRGLGASFEVSAGEGATTLALRGGGAFFLRGVQLLPQPTV